MSIPTVSYIAEISTYSSLYASVYSVIIGSDYDLSPSRHQAIIWTNAGLFLIGNSGTNLSEILIKIQNFPLTKMHMKVPSAKWRPFAKSTDAYMHVLGGE